MRFAGLGDGSLAVFPARIVPEKQALVKIWRCDAAAGDVAAAPRFALAHSLSVQHAAQVVGELSFLASAEVEDRRVSCIVACAVYAGSEDLSLLLVDPSTLRATLYKLPPRQLHVAVPLRVLDGPAVASVQPDTIVVALMMPSTALDASAPPDPSQTWRVAQFPRDRDGTTLFIGALPAPGGHRSVLCHVWSDTAFHQRVIEPDADADAVTVAEHVVQACPVPWAASAVALQPLPEGVLALTTSSSAAPLILVRTDGTVLAVHDGAATSCQVIGTGYPRPQRMVLLLRPPSKQDDSRACVQVYDTVLHAVTRRFAPDAHVLVGAFADPVSDSAIVIPAECCDGDDEYDDINCTAITLERLDDTADHSTHNSSNDGSNGSSRSVAGHVEALIQSLSLRVAAGVQEQQDAETMLAQKRALLQHATRLLALGTTDEISGGGDGDGDHHHDDDHDDRAAKKREQDMCCTPGLVPLIDLHASTPVASFADPLHDPQSISGADSSLSRSRRDHVYDAAGVGAPLFRLVDHSTLDDVTAGLDDVMQPSEQVASVILLEPVHQRISDGRWHVDVRLMVTSGDRVRDGVYHGCLLATSLQTSLPDAVQRRAQDTDASVQATKQSELLHAASATPLQWNSVIQPYLEPACPVQLTASAPLHSVAVAGARVALAFACRTDATSVHQHVLALCHVPVDAGLAFPAAAAAAATAQRLQKKTTPKRRRASRPSVSAVMIPGTRHRPPRAALFTQDLMLVSRDGSYLPPLYPLLLDVLSLVPSAASSKPEAAPSTPVSPSHSMMVSSSTDPADTMSSSFFQSFESQESVPYLAVHVSASRDFTLCQLAAASRERAALAIQQLLRHLPSNAMALPSPASGSSIAALATAVTTFLAEADAMTDSASSSSRVDVPALQVATDVAMAELMELRQESGVDEHVVAVMHQLVTATSSASSSAGMEP